MTTATGWYKRRRVADRLGIDESTLSKIIAGKRVVGWELTERAVERLKLPGDYFLRDAEPKRPNSSEASGSHRSRAPAKLIERLDAGTATVQDVFALAKAVAEDPAVLEARSIFAWTSSWRMIALRVRCQRQSPRCPNMSGHVRHREYEAQRLTTQLEGWRHQLSRASRVLTESGVTRAAATLGTSIARELRRHRVADGVFGAKAARDEGEAR